MIPDRVRIVEVGPRDGLQNEAHPVPVEARIAFIEALADAGLQTIEAGSFVSPRWVPQMAGTAEVLRGLRSRAGVSYPVLVPNMTGFDAAQAAGAREIAVFAAASRVSPSVTSTARSRRAWPGSGRFATRRSPLACGCVGTSRACWAALMKER